MARVVLESLTKTFKTSAKNELCAVKNVCLVVEEGELLVLVGPSGCGKSTVLRMIAGLEEVSSGTILIDGKVVNAVSPQDRDIAMVFQHYALYPHMTVYENMAFGLKLRKLPKSEIDRRVRETAELLGLAACFDRFPDALSGGERQRVAVGRALVRQPKVFLLDEPLSNLDAPMRVQLRREICQLHSRLGATMIYVTHDQVEAMTMGDRIAVMNQGVIQQVEKPLELYHAPANLFVAGFIGSPPMNFLRGTIQRKGDVLWLELPTTRTAAPEHGLNWSLDDEVATRLRGWAGSAVVLGIRPEHLVVGPMGQERAEAKASGQVEAVVEAVEPLGAETLLSLMTGEHSFVARVGSNSRLAANEKVWVTFDMTKAHFFDAATEKALPVCF